MRYDSIEWTINTEGYYVDSKGYKLHRYIWTKHNGEIPKGYVIHHVDHNKLNNDISNLQLMENLEHLKYHRMVKSLYPRLTKEEKLKIREKVKERRKARIKERVKRRKKLKKVINSIEDWTKEQLDEYKKSDEYIKWKKDNGI